MAEPFDSDRDPLGDLRDAWRSLPAPAPADDLGSADPLTRRSVAWLRAAWETVEPPQAAVPPRRGPRLVPRRRALLRLAAAGVAATLAGLLWWNMTVGEEEDHRPTVAIDAEPPAPHRVPEQPVPRGTGQLASLSSEGIEMRSGPVRLVLLTGPRTKADGARTPDTSEKKR